MFCTVHTLFFKSCIKLKTIPIHYITLLYTIHDTSFITGTPDAIIEISRKDELCSMAHEVLHIELLFLTLYSVPTLYPTLAPSSKQVE